ncbi:MAG: hypothetical protein QQN55_08420 [Nitrosopumilus sp.]
MNYKVEDVTDIEEKIALDEKYKEKLCVIPDNLFRKTDEEEYIFAFSLPTIKKLLKSGDIDMHILGNSEEINLIDQRGLEYFVPIFLISSLFYFQNPDAFNIALSMIARYLEQLSPSKKNSKVNFTIYTRDDKTKNTKRIHYEGPIDGIEELKNVVKETMKSFEE